MMLGIDTDTFDLVERDRLMHADLATHLTGAKRCP